MLQKAPIGNGAHESGKTDPGVERFAPVEAEGVERFASPEASNWGESPHPPPPSPAFSATTGTVAAGFLPASHPRRRPPRAAPENGDGSG